MSILRKAVIEYLAIRRALGFKLEKGGQLLHQFAEFAEKQGASFITRKLALQWATEPNECQPARWAIRLRVLRLFAEYQAASDPRTEIPPPGLLPHSYRRRTPYIYTENDVARLIKAAKRLPSPLGLRAETYSTFYGLLAVTGMRQSEARRLDRADVDLGEGILIVRETKFHKSRLVPVHVSTRDALRRYAILRDRTMMKPIAPSFFVSECGKRLSHWNVETTFATLRRRIGLQTSVGRQPRLHDLRHRFATETLVRLYRAGKDVERHIAALATYLGHADVASTYWYLSAIPELLSLASRRVDREQEVTR